MQLCHFNGNICNIPNNFKFTYIWKDDKTWEVRKKSGFFLHCYSLILCHLNMLSISWSQNVNMIILWILYIGMSGYIWKTTDIIVGSIQIFPFFHRFLSQILFFIPIIVWLKIALKAMFGNHGKLHCKIQVKKGGRKM